MKKKLIAATIVASLFVSQLSAFAAFTDLNEERLNWAKEPIEEMTKLNIIKGYEDNTFRPDNPVSRAEALVLMSRITGYYETTSSDYVALAKQLYAKDLEGYATPYKDEVSYLLYRDVLNENDLKTYMADTVATEPLKRYEAAILLTKLMGEEESVAADKNPALTFDDAKDIPAAAKPFVAYVAKNNIMQGMGENHFEPNLSVSRAQMATLLYRVMKNMQLSYVAGTLSLYTQDSNDVKITLSTKEQKNYTVRSSVPVKLDGKTAKLSDFPIGSNIRLTYQGDKVIFAEGISMVYDESTTVLFVEYEKSGDDVILTVKDPKTSKESTYTLAENPTILYEGKTIGINNLKDGDYITLNIYNGKVIYIDSTSKNSEVTGVVDSIVLEPKFGLVVKVGNTTHSYDAYDNVKVRRNGKSVTLADVMAGDQVTLTLSYDVISEIVATSTTSKQSGVIQEIIISNTPGLVVKDDSKLYEFSVSRNAEIIRNGSVSDMYALRLGDRVTVTVEGTTVTKLEITAADENSTITGKVTYVNNAYGYVQLEDVAVLVFTSKAKVQDNAGKQLSLRDIKEGVNVTVFGTQSPGSFEASLIIIN